MMKTTKIYFKTSHQFLDIDAALGIFDKTRYFAKQELATYWRSSERFYNRPAGSYSLPPPRFRNFKPFSVKIWG